MIPKSISSITTVEDLQVYACSKVRNAKDWLMKCADCKNCPVGKKAEELLDKETAPVVAAEKETAASRIEQALKQDDPAGWLVSKGYYTYRKSALEALRRYNRGLFSPNGRGAGNRSGLKKGPISNKNMARDRVVTIFNSAKTLDESVINFLKAQKPDKTIGSLDTKLYQWKIKYPDLVEKYPFLAKTAAYLSKMEFEEMTVTELLQKLSPEESKENEEDEVSLDEFLDEVEEQLQKPATDDFGVDLGDKLNAAAKEAHITPVPATPGQKMLVEMFSAKRKALGKELKECLDRIEAEKQRLDHISKSINDLDNVAGLFGMAVKPKPEA